MLWSDNAADSDPPQPALAAVVLAGLAAADKSDKAERAAAQLADLRLGTPDCLLVCALRPSSVHSSAAALEPDSAMIHGSASN